MTCELEHVLLRIKSLDSVSEGAGDAGLVFSHSLYLMLPTHLEDKK